MIYLIMSDIPDIVPQVEENETLELNLNEQEDDAIDLMDGVGLKRPEPVEVDEVFKEDKEVNDEVNDEVNEPIKQTKVNKNGKPRKPMTKDRLEKLAEARKKALATRQKNKKIKEDQQKTLKIQKIVDDDEEVIIKPKVNNVIIEKETPNIKKLSREEKDKKIQEAVAEGVKKALDVERMERKIRKENKKKLMEEERIKNDKLIKDKQISDTLSKLNDLDNIYGKCFNFH
jgi:hypothetical protein